MLVKKYQLSLFCICIFFICPAVHSQEAAKISNAVPSLAIGTNLLYDLSYTMNLGAMNLSTELSLNKNFTLKLPITWNPWDVEETQRSRLLLVQPELRWWLCEVFFGHFLGIHTHWAWFNVSSRHSGNVENYRNEGWLLGAGLSYGYQIYLAPRWNLELSIGAGYAFTSYDKYECKDCGRLLEENNIYHYFGITQAGITLIYLLK
ncbi:MAG: DUF3575 domain-containing protein [Candidatus Symbiothrix sp.]|jgi:hypothetical protein|nr:DUF3575 domain-containing protein [Candidatus Symbiothrix sp.]